MCICETSLTFMQQGGEDRQTRLKVRPQQTHRAAPPVHRRRRQRWRSRDSFTQRHDMRTINLRVSAEACPRHHTGHRIKNTRQGYTYRAAPVHRQQRPERSRACRPLLCRSKSRGGPLIMCVRACVRALCVIGGSESGFPVCPI